MRVIIDAAGLRKAILRLLWNLVLVAAIALLMPLLHATVTEVLWVAGLCLAAALTETAAHFAVALLKSRGSSFYPSSAPRSRQARLR